MLRFACKRNTHSSAKDDLYCQDLVRRFDNPNYIKALFAPAKERQALLAIHAFSLEISQIQTKTSKSEIAKMRYAFWRDTIASTFTGTSLHHPVSTSLFKVLQHTRLSQSWFKRIIAAHETHIDESYFSNLEALESHAENTSSALIYLQLEAMGVSDLKADHAASHIGKCIGIAKVLKEMPANIGARKLLIPSEILAKVKLYINQALSCLRGCI